MLTRIGLDRDNTVGMLTRLGQDRDNTVGMLSRLGLDRDNTVGMFTRIGLDWDNTVGMLSRLKPDNWQIIVRIQARERQQYFSRIVQTGYVVYLAFYSIGMRLLSFERRRPKHKADDYLHRMTRFRMSGAIPPPPYAFMACT